MTDPLIGRAESASLTWELGREGRVGLVEFNDDKSYDLGPDPDGSRFALIAGRMMSGDYYPPDAVRFSGRFRDEKRDLRAGDRVVQRAPLLGSWGGPLMPSAVEIVVAELKPDSATIAYVTTSIHLGRGEWQATLSRRHAHLDIRVKSRAAPGSFLFWLGLPVARFLQLRARRRAVEVFRALR